MAKGARLPQPPCCYLLFGCQGARPPPDIVHGVDGMLDLLPPELLLDPELPPEPPAPPELPDPPELPADVLAVPADAAVAPLFP